MKTKNLFFSLLAAICVTFSFSSCEDDNNGNGGGGIIEGTLQSPRSMAALNGKVYVSYFDGYLAQIDTASLTIEKQVQVGRYPEYVRVANNKLYVANSGGMDFDSELGYDKTVSVINPVSLTKIIDLDVVLNPVQLTTDSKGNVYVISNGNYGDVPSALQKINASSVNVTNLGLTATYMAMYNDKLYIIDSQFDENWNSTYAFIIYDTETEKVVTENFITDGTVINGPCSINIDPSSGNIYIGTSDYVTDGDMYVFSPEGKLLDLFDTKGLNPMGAYLLSGKGMYILNNGNMDANNANLAFYNFQSKTVEYDIYAAQNGRIMGDTAQDLLVYGSKVYVAMSGSDLIYVLDQQGKEIAVIRSNDGLVVNK
jgi:hypothetical protein